MSRIFAPKALGCRGTAAVDEVIEIAEASSVPLTSRTSRCWVKMSGAKRVASSKTDAARARVSLLRRIILGRVFTQLKSAVISKELQTGGMEGIRARLVSSTERVGMLSDMAMNIERRVLNSLLLVETEDPKWHGLRLDASQKGCRSTPGAAARLLEEGRARVVSFNMTEADIATFMRQPWVATRVTERRGIPASTVVFRENARPRSRARCTLT